MNLKFVFFVILWKRRNYIMLFRKDGKISEYCDFKVERKNGVNGKNVWLVF